MGTGPSELIKIFSGEEWEDQIVLLLGMKYSPGDLIPVPADDHGDLGMDAIARDGTVYQCYAPEGEPLSPAVRKQYLKKKIKDDLGKLIKKQAEHAKVLGTIIVRRWILVTPTVKSKAILAYANEQAEIIRQAGCPYIAADFEATALEDTVVVGAQKHAFISGVLNKLGIDVSEDPSAVDKMLEGTEHVQLVTTLRAKLSKLKGLKSPTKLAKAERNHLKRYLEGRAVLSSLQQDHAQLYEHVVRLKRSFEKLLEMRCDTADQGADGRLIAELSSYKQELENHLGSVLQPITVSHLVGEAVADWLMRCPLDFPEREDA